MSLYSFSNGTTLQKERWREGPGHLMNLDVQALPTQVSVEFVPPGDLDDTSYLAETFFTYDDESATTKVRNDYPAFGEGDGKLESLEAEAAGMGLVYNSDKHSLETPVHELGHAVFAGLPHSIRLQVCELFGADTDDLDVLSPPGSVWEDRIIEGIAETFKEAFLPAQFRVFPNRTNQKISYKDYPQFRNFFRLTAGSGFSYVYGSDSFRVDLSKYGLVALPYHESNRDNEAFVFYEEIPGFEQCFGVDMSEFPESSHHPFSIEPKGGISA